MSTSIGHYKNVRLFGSSLGVPNGLPKPHAFIGMPRPLYADGNGIINMRSSPNQFYYPNQVPLPPPSERDLKNMAAGPSLYGPN